METKSIILRLALSVAILAAAGVGPASALPPQVGDVVEMACAPHVPIKITEDIGPDGFLLGYGPGDQPIPRPGSGVLGGDGTSDDPFVIRGWCVTPGSDSSAPGILIEGTRMHAVIEAVDVRGHTAHGIVVRDAAHVTVRNAHFDQNEAWSVVLDQARSARVEANDITGGAGGVWVAGSTSVVVRDNEIRGAGTGVDIRQTPALVEGNTITDTTARAIHAADSPGIRIVANEVHDNAGSGIVVATSAGARITANTVTHNGESGIHVTGSPGVSMGDNAVTDNDGHGIRVWLFSTSAIVHGNTIERNGFGAVEIFTASGVRVLGNQMVANGGGVRLLSSATTAMISDNVMNDGGHGVYIDASSHHATIEHNTMSGNSDAIVVGAATGVQIAKNRLLDGQNGIVVVGGNPVINHNDIMGNNVGVAASPASVDARHNWWGCPAGAGAPGCDGIIGDLLVSPWQGAPVPSAGPRS